MLPSDNQLRPAKVLIKGKGNLGWMVEEENDRVPVMDLGLTIAVGTVAC